MKGTKAHFLQNAHNGIFFRAQKVFLSLTLYNTLEKVFNFLNLKRIQSVLFILILREKNLIKNMKEIFNN